MRDGVDLVAVLDDAADADSAGAFFADEAFDCAIGLFFVVGFGGVGGDIDKRGIIGEELLHDIKNVTDTAAAGGGDDFVAEEGVFGFM